MNDTTPPPGAPGAAPGRGSDRFFGWLRGLGIVRGSDRWFAGVAGGVAAKAGIDPLIVRGIFVVLAILGGPGVLLYLAGWLLLPDASGRIHLEELFRGRASAGVIVTVVILGALILLPMLIGVFAGLFTGAFPWGWGAFGFFPAWMQTVLSVIWWAVLLPALIIWLIVWISRGGGLGNGGTGRNPGAPADAAAGRGRSAQPAGPASSTGPTASAASAASAQPSPGAAAAGFAAGTQGPAWATAPATAGPEQPAHSAGPDQPASGAAFTPGAAGFAESAETFAERTARQADDWGQRVGARAAEWGEQADAWGKKVGEDARAWGERERERHEAQRLGVAHVVLTLAAALIAAGGAAVWALGSDALSGSPVPGDGGGAFLAAMIAALAVCAVSLIIAGIRGRNSGWVGFLAFCGVVVLLFTAVMPWGSRLQVFGPSTVAVTGFEGSPAGLTVIAGNARIDLGELEEPQDFTLWVLAGNATVELPEDLPVVVEIGVLAGNINEDRDGTTMRQSGPFLNRTVGANLDDAAADEVSRVTVRMVAGNVNVVGANASPGLTGRYAAASAAQHGTTSLPAHETLRAHDRLILEHVS